MRSVLIATIAILVLAAGCSDDTAATNTDPPETTVAPTTEAPTTTAPTTTEAAADAATTGEATPTSTAVAITLEEFSVTADVEFGAGAVSFTASNAGAFPHEFGIAVGASYDDLPKLENGAIDEAALGDDFLGKIDAVAAGESASIDFDLAAGNYVLFCNIQVGPNSHAAAGQTLNVSVS